MRGETVKRPRGKAANVLVSILRTVRRIAGMPDYEAYLEHLRACHPDRPVPSPREYFEEYTASRYGSGVSRCC
jgi:uncharacterized short protein YbdD (DUF466 family)